MLSPEQVREQAAAHHRAERERRQIPAFSQSRDMDIADAYAVQDAWVRLKEALGGGGTSAAVAGQAKG